MLVCFDKIECNAVEKKMLNIDPGISINKDIKNLLALLLKWLSPLILTFKDNAFVKPGTVLLPSRGSKGGYFRASYLIEEQQSSLPVVVSSQFLVITPKQGILPEFLCWSLNRPKMQYWLSEGAGSQGTSLVMLNAKAINSLELKIPDLPTQQKILRINELWEKEQNLTRKLLKNHEAMLQGMFQQLLEEK